MPGLTINLWCENYHKNGKKLKQEIFLKGQSNNTDEKRFFKKRSTARTSTKLSQIKISVQYYINHYTKVSSLQVSHFELTYPVC